MTQTRSTADKTVLCFWSFSTGDNDQSCDVESEQKASRKGKQETRVLRVDARKKKGKKETRGSRQE